MKNNKRDERISFRLALAQREAIVHPECLLTIFLLISLIVGNVLKIKMGLGSLSLNV